MSQAPELRIFQDSQELVREAADLLVWLGGQALARSGVFRVALAGGNTPKSLHAALASEPCATALDWTHVEFYFGDERCVGPDHPESNYGMAESTLFRPLRIAAGQVHRIRGEDEPGSAARAYEEIIRKRFNAPAPEFPRFDLILLGVGEDGHTASLFPGTAALNERTRLVVANQASRGVAQRITCTVPLINAAHAVLFLATGRTKADAVKAVVDACPSDPARFPAQLIRPDHGRLLWFLDQPAAAELRSAKQQLVSHEE